MAPEMTMARSSQGSPAASAGREDIVIVIRRDIDGRTDVLLADGSVITHPNAIWADMAEQDSRREQLTGQELKLRLVQEVCSTKEAKK